MLTVKVGFRVRVHAFAGVESLDEWPNVKVRSLFSRRSTPSNDDIFLHLGLVSKRIGKACCASWYPSRKVIVLLSGFEGI